MAEHDRTCSDFVKLRASHDVHSGDDAEHRVAWRCGSRRLPGAGADATCGCTGRTCAVRLGRPIEIVPGHGGRPPGGRRGRLGGPARPSVRSEAPVRLEGTRRGEVRPSREGGNRCPRMFDRPTDGRGRTFIFRRFHRCHGAHTGRGGGDGGFLRDASAAVVPDRGAGAHGLRRLRGRELLSRRRRGTRAQTLAIAPVRSSSSR